MEECYLRFDKDFLGRRGRKTIYPAGTKFSFEAETMSSIDGGEATHYYVYEKPNVHIGLYDEEEFNEIFMSKNEVRNKKIDKII
jgi:hypothetical protein